MSDHANKPEQYSKPGKRLEHGGTEKKKPPLKPEAAKAKKRERWIMVVMIVLAVIMVLAAAVVLLYNRWVKKPTLPPGPGDTKDPTATLAPGETEYIPDIDAVQPKVGGERKSKDIYTIFVFGADVVSGSTDTMMVVTYDVTNQKAAVMSLPRDTLINVRWSSKQLNSVYGLYQDSAEGIEALKSEVSELVGFTPDYYVKIDWELVGEMVDAIGGVWFDNPYNMRYDDPYQNLFINQPQGNRKLTGDDAMQVVRWRHNGTDPNTGYPYPGGGDGSDLCRLQVQQAFLKAVLKQTLQIQNVAKISQLADLFGRRVESDLSVENLFWFGSQAIFGGLGVDDVEFLTMPNIGVYQGAYKNRVYPDQENLLTIINEKLNPYVEEVTIRQLDLIRVSADGNSLSSSTGVLADPSAGYRPASANPSPRPSARPSASTPPHSQPPESDPPQTSDPVESSPPQQTNPVEPPSVTQTPSTEPPVVEPPVVDPPVVDPPDPPPEQGGADAPANLE